MTARRTARFWTGTGTKDGSPLFALHAVFTSLFGFAGIGLLLRARRYAPAMLLALPLALFPLPYLITHAEFRYRIVVDPILTVCSAYAVTEMYRIAARRGAPKTDQPDRSLDTAAWRTT